MLRLACVLACAGLMLGQVGNPVERAWQLAGKGQRDAAISLLQGVITHDPQNADARLLLGSLLMESGARTGAIEQLTAAARLRPRSAEAQNALGEAYSSFGNLKAAREPFERAVAIKPDFGVAQMNLGEALLDAGEVDAATRHLDRAIALLGHSEDAADAHFLRAKAYSARTDMAKAAGQLQQAVAIRPAFPQAWSELGEALKNLLDDAGALAALERAVSLAPDDAIAQYRVGAEYLVVGKPHLAAGHLAEADHLRPHDQATLNALQMALRQDGRTEEADAVRQQLSELLRRKDEVDQNAVAATKLNNEGAGLQKAGDLRGALEKYRLAVALAPQRAAIRVNYAVALLRLGQWTDGLNELHQAVLLDPTNVKTQDALKEALAQAPAGTVPDWAGR